MKRIISLAAVSAIIFCGCGSGEKGIIQEGDFPEFPQTTEETTKKPDIVVSEYEVTQTTTATTEPEVFGITTIPVNASPEMRDVMSGMTLHEKVCQMFIVTPESLSGYDSVTYSDDVIEYSYSAYPVGGFIFFAQNIESSDQLSGMVADMQNIALSNGVGAFMSVDEEGGSITRVQEKLGLSPLSDMSYYGQLGDAAAAFSVGETLGGYLSDYGFNVDFAPVADVNINPYNELGSRIFSSEPQIVADMSAEVVRGLKSCGVCSTLKHFPGLGAGDDNTHYSSVYIDRTFEELEAAEFVAFRGGIDAGSDFVMVGHQITSAAGDDLPSDLSYTVVTEWLKKKLGFDGLVITDSHAMGAISNNYFSGEAAVTAIEAGVDIVLMPNNLRDAVEGVEYAVQTGRIAEERIDASVAKILEKKRSLGLV